MLPDDYSAPFWLPGGHLQTLYPYFFAPRPFVSYQRERLELADGDFLDLDWTPATQGTLPQNMPRQNMAQPAPLVVLFHGLEGNAQAFYVRNLMWAVSQAGWRGVVVHFRGCSGTPNRLPRAYFAGDSAEIHHVLQHLRSQHHAQFFDGQIFDGQIFNGRLFAVGYSLGGNALLRFAGEQAYKASSLLDACVAVSVPFQLAVAGRTLDTGVEQLIYTRHFLRTLKRKAGDKCRQFPGLFNEQRLRKANSLWAFDEYYTAPAHGFASADDYWARAASLPVLRDIRIPTLLVNARNDPFYPAYALPTAQQVSPTTVCEFYPQGGHVGFPAGCFPGHAGWLPQRILRFFGLQSNGNANGNANK